MSGGQSVGRSDGRTVSRLVGRPVGQTVGRSVGQSDLRPSDGVTLIELLIVLVLLGLLTTLGAVSVTSLRPPPGAARLDTLRATRARAIRTGEAVVIWFDSTRIRFLPDGRVLGGPLDPLTGAWRHEP